MPSHTHLFPALLITATPTPSPHTLGGPNSIPGADCPNCRKPLMLHLTLDASDPATPLGLSWPKVALLYCMRCALSWYDFSYRLRPAIGIDILQANRGQTVWKDWYPEMSDTFPLQSIALRPVPPGFQEACDLLNTETDTGHADLTNQQEDLMRTALGMPPGRAIDAFNQLGGRSFLIAGQPDPSCPRCRRPMSFLASLYNDPHAGIKVMPDGLAAQIIFFLCRPCKTFTVQHRL